MEGVPIATITVEDFAPFSHSSPVSVQKAEHGHESEHDLLSPDVKSHDYNFSGNYDDSSAPSAQDETTDDEMARLNGNTTTSSRSSLSSLPDSVAPSAMMQPPYSVTPTKSLIGDHESGRNSITNVKTPSRRSERDHGSPFRHPSSVRAMQMREDDDLSFVHRRRDSQMTGRMSLFSGRSSNNSSPTKRRSRMSKETKSKKEYPLVLLHCTLLPPTLPLAIAKEQKHLLQDVLPEEYASRWKLLNDRILDNGEVAARGILIPHPKGDYEFLEEKLLESLELIQARIRSGHYLAKEDAVEDEHEGHEEDIIQGVPCPDCGREVVADLDTDRKWEVKVYAANGLMGAGAWSAAWNEMEKIDVEVGVWLPESVRRDVELFLREAPNSAPVGDGSKEYMDDHQREWEVYGETGKRTQNEIDGLEDDMAQTRAQEYPVHGWDGDQLDHESKDTAPDRCKPADPSLSQLLLNSVGKVMEDRKNAAIVLLALLVLWLGVISGPRPNLPALKPLDSGERAMSTPVPETVVSVSVSTITTTALILAPTAEPHEPELQPVIEETLDRHGDEGT